MTLAISLAVSASVVTIIAQRTTATHEFFYIGG